jgi:hypothetical protein
MLFDFSSGGIEPAKWDEHDVPCAHLIRIEEGWPGLRATPETTLNGLNANANGARSDTTTGDLCDPTVILPQSAAVAPVTRNSASSTSARACPLEGSTIDSGIGTPGCPGAALDAERCFDTLDEGRQVGVHDHAIDGECAVVGV